MAATKYAVQELFAMRTDEKTEEMLKRISIEPGIREHVLARNARLGPPRPHSRGRMSSTAAPTSINGYELPPNDDFYLQGKQPMRAPRFARNSPTASIRGRKAKAFLEQHGSPPGHRVTAGGRIVPDGAWPVTSPNKYPAVPVMNPKTIPDGAVDHLQGVLVDIGNDNICQIINGGFVYVGKKNGHLWLVTRPTNNTLSMNGVPLHNSVHPGMPVAMNHYGNGDFSTSGQQVSAQYGGAQYYNESDGYMSNSDMPPWNGYSYTSSPDFYQTNGNVHSVNNQYPGAKPHHTQQQYPSGNAQYHNNKYQYLDHNAQHVGANAQYYGNDTMYPAQGSRYPFNSSVSVGVSPQANVTSGASRENSAGSTTMKKPKVPVGGQRPSHDTLRLLEKVLKDHDQELADLNRNEVINRNVMNAKQHSEVVRKRVELTEKINNTRKNLQETRFLIFGDTSVQPTRPGQGTVTEASRNSSQHRSSSQAMSIPQAPGVFANTLASQHDTSAAYKQSSVGTAGHHGHHSTLPPGLFEPTANEFVPTAYQMQELQKSLPEHQHAGLGKLFRVPEPKPALAERRGNTGLGISTGTPSTTGSVTRTTSRPQESVAHSQIDGLGFNTRRSHAVPIKRPEEVKSQKYAEQHKVNTSAPFATETLVPVAQSKVKDDDIYCGPSDADIQSYMRMVTSPEAPFAALAGGPQISKQYVDQQSPEYGSSRTSYNTGSSAGTGDFFPQNPEKHSIRNWSFSKSNEETVRLSNWLPKEGEVVASTSNVTPVKGTNKFRFNDSDSPIDENYPPYDKRPAALLAEQEMRPAPQGEAQAGAPQQNNKLLTHRGSLSTIANTSFASTRRSGSNKAPSTPTKRTPPKTDDYWDGFRIGFQDMILPDNTTAECRRGYRDGLKNSNLNPNSTPTKTSDGSPHRLQSAFGPVGSATKTTASLPRHPSNKGQSFSPWNPATDSPLRQSFAHSDHEDNDDDEPFVGPSLLPKASERQAMNPSLKNASPFDPMPAVRIVEPVSPLANRMASNEQRRASKALPYVPGSRIFSGKDYAQQRYVSKGQASVAPSSGHARGHFPQLDGSNDDDDRPIALEEAQGNIAAGEPASPTNKGKQKAPSSPIKRASSAMRQLTSISSSKKEKATIGDDVSEAGASTRPKKEDDPAKMTGAEKSKWKGKWKRRFEEMKKVEQQEIEANKKRNARM